MVPTVFSAMSPIIGPGEPTVDTLADRSYNETGSQAWKEYGGEMVSTEVMRHEWHAEVPPILVKPVEHINCRTSCSRGLIERHAVPGAFSCGVSGASTEQDSGPV